MHCLKQISFLVFLYAILYFIIGCGIEKPNQPIENTIDTLFYSSGDTLVDTTVDTIRDTIAPVPDNFMITIERAEGVYQLSYPSIDINMIIPEDSTLLMGGFNFLISYDARILTFQSVEPGQFLLDCGWEYFTYRFQTNIDCGTDCLRGEIRITTIAEMNNGVGNHPICYGIDGTVSNQLAFINFRTTPDRTYECAFGSISFIWGGCDENTLDNVTNDQYYMSRNIYKFIDSNTIDFDTNFAVDDTFPTFHGANSECDTLGIRDPLRIIDFVNGGIDLACAALFDFRGDINLNEIAYEIADAVLYVNYFIYGTSIFTVNLNGQIASSDINVDGKTLTVADLVYLIRIITGDAEPYPEELPQISTLVTRVKSDGTLHVNTKMGAMLIVIEGNATFELLVSNMSTQSYFDGTNTRILLYSLEGNTFFGDFMKVLGNIVSIEFGSADGAMLVLDD